MKIVATHSHFNGLEYLLVHEPELWRGLTQAIERVDVDESHLARIGEALAGLITADSRVALDVQSEDESEGFEALARLYLQYVRDEIDVGIEILPMKSLQSQMSSGPGYYEGELYNVIRNGRGVPAVPLVMIGVAP
jgi:hypothetical protein